jgi:ketosteroid isomerase-like protein
VSQENVEIARQAHEAFNRPDLGVFDLDALYRLADPDLVLDWSRSNGLEAGIYRGEAATRRFWNTFFEAFERVVVEPLEFIEHGESVVVPHHLHAWGRDGVEVDAHSTVVFTIRDGRIIELRLYRQTAEALEAAGLAGSEVSRENVEAAERAMDAFNRRDIDAFVQPTTADFEWFPALGMAAEGGSFRGR